MSLEIFSVYAQNNNRQNTTEFNIDVDELNEHSPRHPQPENCLITLKPHQLTLLQRCINYEQKSIKIKDYPSVANVAGEDDSIDTRIGIIGDRYGSGKSYVILALMMSNKIYAK